MISYSGNNLRDTLRKHIKGPSHQNSLRVKCIAEQEEFGRPSPDGPTDAQLLITLRLMKKDPLGSDANDYVTACKEARGSGDLENVPAHRCSKFTFPQNVTSLAAMTLEGVHNRLVSKKNPVKFMCWAEDGAGQYEQMICRTVYKNREEEDILIAWFPHEGKKSGIEKAEAMEAALTNFTKKRPEAKMVIKTKAKAFIADGEAAEPLAATFAKLKEYFDFRYAGRCLFHSKQKSMQNAVDTVESFREWLDLLVRNYSDSRGHEMGGLCRALANRDRHRHTFAQDIEKELQEVLSSLQELEEEWAGHLQYVILVWVFFFLSPSLYLFLSGPLCI